MVKRAPPPTLAQRFAVRLHALLDERGFKIDDLVRASEVLTYGACRRWLSGTRFPTAQSLVNLARALGVAPEVLLDGIPVGRRVLADVAAVVRASGPSAAP